ncbi:MAG: AmmeMemoRadiSam system protein A [Desulfamplus sp.]|nr:AmmeMemoRadiSam system protein A [Desulfamplus sp.]
MRKKNRENGESKNKNDIDERIEINSCSYSEAQGKELLRLARSSIAAKLKIKSDLPKPSLIMETLKEEIFNLNVGTFVTIHINKKLRGCIGTLESVETVKEDIKQNAISAAFQDPRFPPLTSKEFNDIHLEISILSQPVTLEYSDSDDLLSKLQPGVHGLIISKGGARATFLPQVWQQLPDKSQFLSNLCRKAGLSEGEWKRGTLEVMIYTVQYFEE